MELEAALAGVPTLARTGVTAEITGIQYDSRRVRPGDLFVAMRGGATDGNRFLASALDRGASAIVTDSPEAYGMRDGAVPFVLVERGRRALAGIAANLLDHPERKLKVSAVTGTNGKTTTAFLLEQMLRSVGRKCVLIGTIETHIGDEIRPSEHTTPEASDLLQIFADGVAAGCTEVVMEMSSHALDQERVWGIPVDVAIFTNLTQDHLDYHGTMEKYAAAKTKLFRGVGAPPPQVAVINEDAEYQSVMADTFRTAGGKELISFSACNYGTVQIEAVSLSLGKTSFRLARQQCALNIQSPLTGRVNVENLTAAICAASARGLTPDQVVNAASSLQQVPGRFQIVPGSSETGFPVVVDYAHTDDALRNLIWLAREEVGAHNGRVITLFGCGGDRDRTKRPRMGRAAGEGSDLVILTSDNPRSEDPAAILAGALAGVRETATECIVEPDRAKAIALAIRTARPGDIVLLAGKGHEKVQILADRTIPFDDVAVAAEILANL
jgi:UDP-N-acetylmuramoyl-L-alanyl-D-glutamate--2,6-diaminopimelate ligase